ncbi:hypothetical protein SSCG_03458 [Streptomyces clavuligerus]|nr:hypothetical protein SSCG_03458 [Streptomyces clavuligerus]
MRATVLLLMVRLVLLVPLIRLVSLVPPPRQIGVARSGPVCVCMVLWDLKLLGFFFFFFSIKS